MRTGNGRNSTVFTRLKIAVLAPIQRERNNCDEREAGRFKKFRNP